MINKLCCVSYKYTAIENKPKQKCLAMGLQHLATEVIQQTFKIGVTFFVLSVLLLFKRCDSSFKNIVVSHGVRSSTKKCKKFTHDDDDLKAPAHDFLHVFGNEVIAADENITGGTIF